MQKKSQSELRRVQELRRSNAATPIANQKKYTRQSNKKMLELEKKERQEG
jgi:predicted metal-binding protein